MILRRRQRAGDRKGAGQRRERKALMANTGAIHRATCAFCSSLRIWGSSSE